MYIPSPGAGGGGGGEGAGEGGEEIQKLLSQLALIKQAALESCVCLGLEQNLTVFVYSRKLISFCSASVKTRTIKFVIKKIFLAKIVSCNSMFDVPTLTRTAPPVLYARP